jgi:uncharacterized protein (DUF885 family)
MTPANEEIDHPFESVESAQEFVDLLVQAIDETQAEIQEQLRAAVQAGHSRHEQALQLVAYKLQSLAQHMTTSRRLLNDLRTLRRLLLEERPLRGDVDPEA